MSLRFLFASLMRCACAACCQSHDLVAVAGNEIALEFARAAVPAGALSTRAACLRIDLQRATRGPFETFVESAGDIVVNDIDRFAPEGFALADHIREAQRIRMGQPLFRLPRC